MNLNLNHAWLACGVAVLMRGIYVLAVYQEGMALLSIAIGVLVSYTSVKNLGGIRNIFK